MWHRTVDRPTNRAFCTWSQSLQEAEVSEDLLLERLNTVGDDKQAVGLVLASRSDGERHLALENLVQLGRAFGWRIEAALLDPAWRGGAGYLAATRAELAALDVPVTMLDGRRWPARNTPRILRLLLGQ